MNRFIGWQARHPTDGCAARSRDCTVVEFPSCSPVFEIMCRIRVIDIDVGAGRSARPVDTRPA